MSKKKKPDNVVFNDGEKAVDENALAITIMFTIIL